MTHRWCLSLVAALVAGSLCVAAPPSPGHPIIGTWRVYVAGTDCVETWEFRADGTTHNFSGAEDSYSEYEISPNPTQEGYYKLVDTITRTNGQPDCLGNLVPVGDRSTGYLVPLSADRFKLCFDVALSRCAGVMIRASRPSTT